MRYAPRLLCFAILLLASAARAAEDTWWSLRPLALPALPQVSGDGWARNSIDPFVLAKLREKTLEPASEADRRTLLRRLTLDLLGLAPTPEEVDAFVYDPAADAYERVVERLLSNPHYGERWARHWMDVAHYAETHGTIRTGLGPTPGPIAIT